MRSQIILIKSILIQTLYLHKHLLLLSQHWLTWDVILNYIYVCVCVYMCTVNPNNIGTCITNIVCALPNYLANQVLQNLFSVVYGLCFIAIDD